MYEYSKTVHFTRNYKFITKRFGPVVSTFLSHLIDQHDLRMKGKKKVVSFFISRNQIAEETQIKRKAQMTCEAILVDCGIISIETRDYNAHQYTIHYQAIEAQAPSAITDQNLDIQLPTDEQGGSIHMDGAAPSLRGEELPTRVGANYISTRSITKSVSIPARTDFHIQSALTESNTSCIKNEIVCTPTVRVSSLEQIIRKYNKAMHLDYDPADEATASLKYNELLSIERFLNPVALEYVWKVYSDEKTKADVKIKRISAFIKYKLLDDLQKHKAAIAAYCTDYIDQRLNSIFRTYSGKVNELIKSDGFTCDLFGSITPIKEDGIFTTKDERIMRTKILHDHLLPVLPRDERRDMIKVLEAV